MIVEEKSAAMLQSHQAELEVKTLKGRNLTSWLTLEQNPPYGESQLGLVLFFCKIWS